MNGRTGLAATILVVMLAGCARPPSSQELDRQTDCRAQVDRQYEKQNRYLLSEQDQTGTPFSSHGIPGDTNSGLGDVYRRDRNVDACLHSTATDPR